MGTVYMIDSHTPVLLDSEINDTIPIETGETQILNGSFPVNVPFGIPIDGAPADLTELLTQKFTGLLAFYPGYMNLDYDEGIDSSGWDAANSQGVCIGDRGTSHIIDGGALRSNVTVLSSAPSAAIITWEVFEILGFLTENAKDGVKVSRYEEKDPSDLTVWASFDGGTTWINPVTEGVQFSIPAWQQGTNFIIRFSNSSGDRLWVGSWAVIY
jgi:hypothetical protein